MMKRDCGWVDSRKVHKVRIFGWEGSRVYEYCIRVRYATIDTYVRINNDGKLARDLGRSFLASHAAVLAHYHHSQSVALSRV
jgi:hypothetical protein